MKRDMEREIWRERERERDEEREVYTRSVSALRRMRMHT